MEKLQVAKTIMEQLGGGMFAVMTGAKNFVGSSDGVSFKIGTNAKKVSHVRVTLNGSDLYDLKFLRIRGTSVQTVAEESDVYAEDLRKLFTANTGLYTRL
jgi:hypothetical protein